MNPLDGTTATEAAVTPLDPPAVTEATAQSAAEQPQEGAIQVGPEQGTKKRCTWKCPALQLPKVKCPSCSCGGYFPEVVEETIKGIFWGALLGAGVGGVTAYGYQWCEYAISQLSTVPGVNSPVVTKTAEKVQEVISASKEKVVDATKEILAKTEPVTRVLDNALGYIGKCTVVGGGLGAAWRVGKTNFHYAVKGCAKAVTSVWNACHCCKKKEKAA